MKKTSEKEHEPTNAILLSLAASNPLSIVGMVCVGTFGAVSGFFSKIKEVVDNFK